MTHLSFKVALKHSPPFIGPKDDSAVSLFLFLMS